MSIVLNCRQLDWFRLSGILVISGLCGPELSGVGTGISGGGLGISGGGLGLIGGWSGMRGGFWGIFNLVGTGGGELLGTAKIKSTLAGGEWETGIVGIGTYLGFSINK